MEHNRRYTIPEGILLEYVCRYPVLASTRARIDQGVPAACILNEAGEFIWKCLEAGKKELSIVEEATRVFEEDPDVVRDGVKAFLDSMEQQGFLIPVSDG